MHQSPDRKTEMASIQSSSGCQIFQRRLSQAANVFPGVEVRLASVKVCQPQCCDWLHMACGSH